MTDSTIPQSAKPPAVRSAPRRVLWLLALLVVVGHWLLLDAIPRDLTIGPATDPMHLKTLVFNTRRIEVPPVKVVQAVQTAPTPPKPVLIQKPKKRPLKDTVVEPVMPPVVVAEVAAETIPADPEPTLPAEPPVSVQPAAENATPASAAIDVPTVEPVEAPPSVKETPTAQANLTIPGSVRLKYEMTGLSRGLTYYASGEMTWRQDGSRYEATMVVSAFLIGSRSLSSLGDITVDGLAPKRFADKFRSEQVTHFQADKGKITFSANTPDAPWKRGAQDRLSVFFQLASLLAGEPDRFPPGTKIPMYTAGQKDVDTWTFSISGSEVLNLPYGPVTAVKLTRDPRQAFDQRVEAWFAPSLGYWPVRIKITQHEGDYLDQQLSGSGPP